ncbi:bone morphogenetic protein 2-A-like isoform X2 [Ptychodera flava]
MRSKPNVTLANVTEEEKRRMLRVYEQSVQENNHVHDLYPEDNFYPKRFYSLIDTGEVPPKVKKDEWTNGDGQRFYFELGIPLPAQPNHKLRVHTAKLKLYKEGIRTEYIPNSLDGPVRVDVYLLLEPVRTGKKPLKRLLDTKVLSLFETGWDTFDIADGVETWLARPDSNYGLEVNFVTDEKLPKRLIYAQGRELELENEISQEEDSSPMLNLQLQEVPTLSRSRRYIHDDEDCKADGDRCCRSPLHVSFKEIHWDDWILSPPGYDAFYCDGSCPHNHRPANTHTLIKSSINLMSRGASPKPCCTPRALSDLTLLHFDDTYPEPKLIVTAFSDMVVDQCVCS